MLSGAAIQGRYAIEFSANAKNQISLLGGHRQPFRLRIPSQQRPKRQADNAGFQGPGIHSARPAC